MRTCVRLGAGLSTQCTTANGGRGTMAVKYTNKTQHEAHRKGEQEGVENKTDIRRSAVPATTGERREKSERSLAVQNCSLSPSAALPFLGGTPRTPCKRTSALSAAARLHAAAQ